MAINYTYPVKTSPASSDDILIIDNDDSSKATKRVKISTLPISGSGGGTVTSVTSNAPLSVTNSTTIPDLTISLATASTDGYLNSTDWNTFNNKLSLTGGAMTGPITTNSTFDGVDVAARDAVLTTTTTTANAALPLAGGAMTGNITTSGLFAGRNVATDGTKLDGVEALADVTDVANVTAAGALMESTITNVAQVKSFDSSDYATAAQGTLATNALPLTGGTMTGAITSGSSITALQLIPAAVTLVITTGASGNQDLVLYDTEFGTFSSFNISASGIPIVEFYINSLTEGATAELFLTTTPTAYVQPSAWQTIPSGGVATPILWPGGTPPNTSSGGVYKFTFTMAGGVVYGVADLAFA